MPYRSDPARGSGNNSPTDNATPAPVVDRRPADGDNRGGTTEAILRSPTTITDLAADSEGM